MHCERLVKYSTAALLAVATSTAVGQNVVNISGATLFEDFFTAPSSTSDFLDIDNDGVITELDNGNFVFDQLAGTGNSVANVQSNYFAVQYRTVGSGNGLGDLVAFGQSPATGTLATSALSAPPEAYINRSQFYDRSLPAGSQVQGIGNTSNPGASPFLSPGGGVKIDIAVSDVPIQQFVTQAGTNNWNSQPGAAGYGNSPILSNPTADGTGNQAGGQGNQLKSIGSLTLNDPSGTNGSNQPNNIANYEIAWVPVAFIANHGTGIDGDGDGTADGNIRKSELQHLYVTGRMDNGENLIAATRDSGSGTRNAAMNSLGVDPSAGVGDNVGLKHAERFNDTNGEDFNPTNKNSSSRMEQTVRTNRLTVGYTGLLGDSKAAVESAEGQYEILSVMNDTAGGTLFVRPTLNNAAPTQLDPTVANGRDGELNTFNNIIFNGDANTGYQVGGSESFYTIGSALSETIYVDASGNILGSPPVDETAFVNGGGRIFQGDNTSDVAMENKAAALYVRNILSSLESFSSAGPNGTAPVDLDGDGNFDDIDGDGIINDNDPNNGLEDPDDVVDLLQFTATPGQLLASQFSVVAAVEALPDIDPGTAAGADQFVANPNENNNLQDSSVLPTQTVVAYGSQNFGRTPDRLNLIDDGVNADYGDGVAGGNEFVQNDGTAVGYNVDMTGAFGTRNAVAFDFDADGDRDKSDIGAMVTAYENSLAAGSAATVDAAGNLLYARDSGDVSAADLATNDPLAVLEIIGDADGDGDFDLEDVRYAGDGLFGYASDNAGASGDELGAAVNRKFNFTAIDNASTTGNLFGTSLGNAGSLDANYNAGDSRGDIAGSGTISAGATPQGSDGIVDAQDIDYVFDQFVNNSFVTDGSATWSDLDEAQGFDLSADMTGDLSVDQADVDELVVTILGTAFGDANLDGKVDVLDLDVLAQAFNTAVGASWADADFTGDDAVDVLDLDVLAQNFGFSSTAPSSVLSQAQFNSLLIEDYSGLAEQVGLIPEPGSIVLLGAAGGLLLRRRRNA
jgi:hypothetical protein